MRVPRSALAQLPIISGATMVNDARPIAVMVFLIWSDFILGISSVFVEIGRSARYFLPLSQLFRYRSREVMPKK